MQFQVFIMSRKHVLAQGTEVVDVQFIPGPVIESPNGKDALEFAKLILPQRARMLAVETIKC